MVITHVLASSKKKHAAAARAKGHVGLALYHIGRTTLAGVGHTLPHSVRKLPHPPTIRAWDFLSLALAVYGADRLVLRGNSPDGWTRVIALDVEVVDPAPWQAQAMQLAEALRFLSGDIWYVKFQAGGRPPPDFPPSLTDRDCACLFSGGLDSLIGAIDLIGTNRRPLLVSQASPKEGPVQQYLAHQIGLSNYRFEGRAIERAEPPYEPSSRARSMLFFAYGALAADGLGGELIVPENGLISINPPLTRRRIGSLSTRTTHPHFVDSLQSIFDKVDLKVKINTPYSYKTKGEMLRQCADQALIARLAAPSYSCGKGKRLNKHCGRCLPCLIRRASFYAAGMSDATKYASDDLSLEATNDDVFAARYAVAGLPKRNFARWAAEAGPLPSDPKRHAGHVDVVKRGMNELKDFLATVKWP